MRVSSIQEPLCFSMQMSEHSGDTWCSVLGTRTEDSLRNEQRKWGQWILVTEAENGGYKLQPLLPLHRGETNRM